MIKCCSFDDKKIHIILFPFKKKLLKEKGS